MRELVAAWVSLSHGRQDAAQRTAVFQKITDRALSNASRKIELYNQLCRKVEGASDLNRKRNTWNLLDRVLNAIPCPEVSQKHFIDIESD